MNTPESVADALLASVGRVAWRDLHVYSYATRLAVRIIDMNVLVCFFPCAFCVCLCINVGCCWRVICVAWRDFAFVLMSLACLCALSISTRS